MPAPSLLCLVEACACLPCERVEAVLVHGIHSGELEEHEVHQGSLSGHWPVHLSSLRGKKCETRA